MALWGTAGFSIVLASLFTRWWTRITCSKSWNRRGGGHATTAMMEHSHIFLLQSILLSIASNDGAHMLDEPQDATKLIVLEPTTGKQWFLGPILVDFKLGALGACQHWSSATMPLQKPLSHASHSRHATTAMKERSDIFLLQVRYLNTSTCRRSSNYCLLVVSCPGAWLCCFRCVWSWFRDVMSLSLQCEIN